MVDADGTSTQAKNGKKSEKGGTEKGGEKGRINGTGNESRPCSLYLKEGL